jgi:hypothetical protein
MHLFASFNQRRRNQKKLLQNAGENRLDRPGESQAEAGMTAIGWLQAYRFRSAM